MCVKSWNHWGIPCFCIQKNVGRKPCQNNRHHDFQPWNGASKQEKEEKERSYCPGAEIWHLICKKCIANYTGRAISISSGTGKHLQDDGQGCLWQSIPAVGQVRCTANVAQTRRNIPKKIKQEMQERRLSLYQYSKHWLSKVNNDRWEYCNGEQIQPKLKDFSKGNDKNIMIGNISNFVLQHDEE